MPKTLRVGLIGYRFMGRAHSSAWRQAPRFFPLTADVEMHTICGRDATGVEAARGQLGWQHASTDWRDVIDSPLIDIVDIVTPTDTHADIAIAAAQNGKHVLCEKPLALNVKQAQAMLDAAQTSRVVHMVCHNYRRIPAIALAKKMIGDGALGRIFHYRARYAQDRLVDPEYPLDWRLQKETSGSGVHGDINSHLIDLGRYLVGEFKDVCGLTHTFIGERPVAQSPGQGATPRKMGTVTVPDSAMFMARLESGGLANLEATRYAYGRKNHIEIEINGSRGSLYFDCDDPRDRQGFRDILVTERDGVHPYVSHWWPPGHIIGYEHTFVHTIADFVNACVDGTSVHPTFDDGLKNQQVLEAVEVSARAGRWVKV
jgi:predicted dehydrogenase